MFVARKRTYCWSNITARTGTSSCRGSRPTVNLQNKNQSIDRRNDEWTAGTLFVVNPLTSRLSYRIVAGLVKTKTCNLLLNICCFCAKKRVHFCMNRRVKVTLFWTFTLLACFPVWWSSTSVYRADVSSMHHITQPTYEVTLLASMHLQ